MQITFELSDLTDIRLIPPGPMLETVLAAWTLQARPPDAVHKNHITWRRRVAPVVGRIPEVRQVLEIQRPPYTLIDLCLPAVAASWEEGLEQLNALEPDYFRLELSMIAEVGEVRARLGLPTHHIPRWTEQLAERDRRPRARLIAGLRLLHEAGLRDRSAADTATAQAFIDRRLRDLASGGINRLMDNLHPWIRWHPPVLSVDIPGEPPLDLPSPAGGRGLVITPSVFATQVQYFFDGAGARPSLLIVPVQGPEWPAHENPRLGDLLGRKRAAILVQLAAGATCTSDLADRCAITPGAVSEHTRILRESGLITTDRGRQAIHSITPAGAALIRAHLTGAV